MGDLYRALGQGEQARRAYEQSLEIFERLARAEPDRADYQRGLAVSYERMGDLYLQQGEVLEARLVFEKVLRIRERAVQQESERADLQRELIVPLVRLGTLDTPDAHRHLQRAWTLLMDLKDSGRLAPADEGMIPALRGLLEGGSEAGG